MVKVSVIIPVYNVERYLSRCLDSCILQTFKDIEIICVNDGSTDSSLSILQAYANLDSRVKIITKENGGLSSARNVGIANSVGEYVLCVDSDDYISSIAVEKLYNNAVNNNSDVVIFDYFINHFESQKSHPVIMGEMKSYSENVIFNAELVSSDMYKYMHVCAWAKLYKREFLLSNNISYVEGIVYEDVPYMAEIYTKASRITYLPEMFYSYTVGRDSQIMSKNDETMFDVIKVYEHVDNSFKNSRYYDKYKYDVQLMKVMDFFKKFNTIKAELREKLFDTYRSLSLEIDFDYLEKKEGLLPIEKFYIVQFKNLLTANNYDDYMKVYQGVSYV